jgi:hypothetical protein
MPEECEWYGVSCISFDNGDGLGNQLVAESIVLPLNSLDGCLSPDLRLFTRLPALDLSQNNLKGTLLIEWKDWRYLNEFKMNNNSSSGTVPREYGPSGANLKLFHIGYNGITSVVPNSIGHWSNLTLLCAESNDFKGAA